jgi:hypothetical protein
MSQAVPKYSLHKRKPHYSGKHGSPKSKVNAGKGQMGSVLMLTETEATAAPVEK